MSPAALAVFTRAWSRAFVALGHAFNKATLKNVKE